MALALFQMNNHTVCADAKGQSFAVRMQAEIDAIWVLYPHLALARLAGRPPGAGLTVYAVEIFEPVKVVDGASCIEPRNPDATDPQTSQGEGVAPTVEQ